MTSVDDIQTIDIVFDGPPGSNADGHHCNFVEVEGVDGRSISAGEWIDRGNGLWALRLNAVVPSNERTEHMHWTPDASLGERATVWRSVNHPESNTVPLVSMKATEELGELNRAVLGEIEGRPDRGDPLQEGAQAIIVIASLVYMHTGKDVLEAVAAEMQRNGA